VRETAATSTTLHAQFEERSTGGGGAREGCDGGCKHRKGTSGI
jgi:hypothetical protein